jgi:hypothetical protein
MEKLKVLVLGNDTQINEIQFDRLPKNIITLGVNRIWLKHTPNYFFFNDYEMIKELRAHPEHLAKIKTYSTSYSSDWLLSQLRKKGQPIPTWLKIYQRPNKTKFPDSITSAIEIFRANLQKSSEVTFYVAGVSLRWQNPSHFWKELDYTSLNRHGENWYTPRFNLILENFKRLKSLNYDIVSVHPDSSINKLFRYENIGNLYSKEL